MANRADIRDKKAEQAAKVTFVGNGLNKHLGTKTKKMQEDLAQSFVDKGWGEIVKSKK